MVYTFDISQEILEIQPRFGDYAAEFKGAGFNNFDIDAIYVDRFNEQMKNFTAREFIEKIIVDKLGAIHLIVGFNYRFGKNAMCGHKELIEYCKEYGIEVSVMEPFYVDNIAVSSTIIRSMLVRGEVDTAAKYLGRYFFIVNKVIKRTADRKCLGC
jgi:riboflavin kinase/FMN adenylyltransferase